jgi:hypothetical protein
VGCPQAELQLTAPRPKYSVLGSERATLMPTLDHAIQRYVEESGFAGRLPSDEEVVTELLGA